MTSGLAPKKIILASPWIFTAAVGILLGIVLIFAVDNLRREEQRLTENLFSRGQEVIRMVEVGARSTAMRMAAPDPLHFQHLLEQTDGEESILYVAVVDQRGQVLAHSNPELVGDLLPFPLPPEGPAPNLDQVRPGPAAHRLLPATDSTPEIFEVYAPFTPWAGRGRHWRNLRERNLLPPQMGRMMNSSPPLFTDSQFRLILVGLDMSGGKEVINRNRRHIFFISLALLLAGIGGWTALLALQGYRKEMEREVQRHEHLVSLGKMAAGVAHEVRNPLSSIKGLATLLGQRFPAGDRDQDTARLLIDEVERLNRSIGELLNYARPLPLKRQPVNLNLLLESSLKLVAADAQALRVKLDFSPNPELPQPRLDPDRITQVLLNLYLNALQAMPGGGVLRVRAAADSEGHIRLTISDNGIGIPQPDLTKVTDPYFTTKPDGSGLGLAMVQKIIDEHGGKITITSRENQGTEVTISL